MLNDILTIRCDECELKKKKVVICLECIETLCSKCDSRIHNKGTRVKHRRVSSKPKFYEDKDSDFEINYFSLQCYRNNFTNLEKKSNEIKKLAFDYILEETKKGRLMVLFENLAEHIRKFLETEDEEICNALLEKKNGTLFHQTIRTFGDYPSLKYFSLRLNCISIESLFWIMRSIEIDRMKPTESLIHSRFKECFAIQIRKEWKIFMELLENDVKLEKKMNFFENVFGKLIIKKEDKQPTIFLIENENWDYEDLVSVDESEEVYQIFLKFLDKFFEESFETKEKESIESEQEIKKWFTSVENSHVKNSFYMSEINYKKILKNKDISKLIPGGKYGCALMLKNCGPEKLKEISLGKILSFVSHALNKKILVHVKTFIVKNSTIPRKPSKETNKLIKEIQDRIISVIQDKAEKCVTLAQLPSLISNKFGKTYDLVELGFPKLKNFLETMKEYVELEEYHKNHIKVKLIKERKNEINKLLRNSKSIKSINSSLKYQPKKKSGFVLSLKGKNYYQNTQKREGYRTLKPNAFDEKCKQIDSRGLHFVEHKKSFSTFQDYLQDIKFFVIKTLKKHNFGIEIQKLENSLSSYLGTKFNPKIFKVENFQEFLLNNFEDCLDIQLMKPLKSKRLKGKKKTTLMVYPSNYSKMNRNNFSKFNPKKIDEYGLYFDNNYSGFFSEQSANLNNIQKTTDSLSDASFLKTLSVEGNRHNKSFNPFSHRKNDDSMFKGFDLPLISPIPSQINCNNEKEEDCDDEDYDFDTSRKFIEDIISED